MKRTCGSGTGSVYHQVGLTDEAITAAVTLQTKRYISDRSLPDKAIDLIDENCPRGCGLQRSLHLSGGRSGRTAPS